MEFKQILKKYKNIVDQELEIFFDYYAAKQKDDFLKTSYLFLKDYVLRGGKRIRPIASIMVYKSVTDENEKKMYKPALNAELFHCSSLIHDDIMDEDEIRRKKPSMHVLFEKFYSEKYNEVNYKGHLFNKFSKRFGVSMAIIQGNILYSLAESCILNSDFDDKLIRKALIITNQAYRTVNKGQMQDLLLEMKIDAAEKHYLEMASNKTARLISAAIEIGCLFGNASQKQIKALKNYAELAALTFQIQDDIMDVSKNMEKGYSMGSDIKKGKKTLIVMHALSKATEKQKNTFMMAFGNENASYEQINNAVNILNETQSIDYARKTAYEKIKKAKSYLKAVKSNITKEGFEFFNSFADFMLERKI